MSKDGDWIIREDEESLNYILNVLAGYGAKYRFGAPFDMRWMKGRRRFTFRSNGDRKMIEMKDEFLSEEDLDLRNLSEHELYTYWNYWLEQAQSTNDRDRYLYSHGVFTEEPHDPNNESITTGSN